MARFARFAAQYLTHVPRLPHWGGFAVTPERMEFWQGPPSRLHDRAVSARWPGRLAKAKAGAVNPPAQSRAPPIHSSGGPAGNAPGQPHYTPDALGG